MDDPPSDPWAPIAPLYDLDLRDFDDDLEMYVSFAQRSGSGVLELGCGTGRVLAALAEDGHAVTGVDYSAAMLAWARRRLDALTCRTPPELIEGDMRSIDLGRRFGRVIVPFGGLQHLETPGDGVDALTVVARHLEPGGLALVDVEAPHPEDLEAGPQPLVQHWVREFEGGTVTKLVAFEGRPADGIRDVTFHFDVQPPEGALRRVTQQFWLRVITPGELELAARLAGLRVVDLYGDYDLSPFADGSARLIALLEHAS